MKLTTFLMLITLLQVSARGYSQVTLKEKNAPLEKVIRSIKAQTGYYFVYSDQEIKSVPITVNLKNATIEEALAACFKDQPITYKVVDKNIILQPKEVSLIDKIKAVIAQETVRGRVLDETGAPLIGVTVKIKETQTATATDANGYFAITVPDKKTILQFSFVGYETQDIQLSENTLSITVTLKVISTNLKEVVVGKGYYNVKRELNTGNVSQVTSAELEKNTVSDPIVALEGRVPGLYIYQSSGIANSAPTVRLRGQNSIANGNNPLFIVDGVPFTSTTLTTGLLGGAAGNLSPFSNIPLSEIDRIEVLKDADATAIYGSRGANGVILITTKKGKAGKTKVDFNLSGGAGEISNKLKLLNTQDYLSMRRKALANDGITTPASSDYDLNGSWGDINRYTDWQKELIGGTSNLYVAQGNVSGGNEYTQFLFGGEYRKETSVFPGDFNDVKASGHINLNHISENGKFRANIAVFYQNDNNRLPSSDLTSNILLAPNAPTIYNPDGTFNWANSTWNNPVWNTTVKTNSITDNLNTSINLGYSILKDLSLNLRAGYNDIRMNSTNANAYVGYNPAVTILPAYRSNSFGTNRIKTWIIEPSLNYAWRKNKHNIESLIGGTFQQNDQNGIGQYASGFASAALIYNIQAASSLQTSSFIDTRYRYNAVYARIGYTYDDQYLLNLTGRRDGSSRFGPGRQFANLGAIGAGWIFSKQDFFIKHLPLLSFGKIRGSYGITGNDQLTDYQYLSTYSSNNLGYQGVTGLQPTSLTNTSYGWETVKKLEFGLDLGFINDRIYLSGSWYRNRTGNQLVGYALPAITGFPTVQANLPAVIQNTGIEIELTTENIKGKNFSWTTSANLTIPRNKLVSYPNLAGSPYASRFVVGQPLSIAFLYHYTGISPNTNIYTFEDVNKDGSITNPIDTKPVFVGQKFYGSINNSFRIFDFQIDFLLQYVNQNGFGFTGYAAPGILAFSGPNQLFTINSAQVQKLTQSYSSDAYRAYSLYNNSDGILRDASFLRLKNFMISWNAPDMIKKKLHVGNVKIFAQGQNLFTMSNFDGLDPEIASNGTLRGTALLKLPTLRMYTAGIQLSL